jgi:hypothetical protein
VEQFAITSLPQKQALHKQDNAQFKRKAEGNRRPPGLLRRAGGDGFWGGLPLSTGYEGPWKKRRKNQQGKRADSPRLFGGTGRKAVEKILKGALPAGGEVHPGKAPKAGRSEFIIDN